MDGVDSITARFQAATISSKSKTKPKTPSRGAAPKFDGGSGDKRKPSALKSKILSLTHRIGIGSIPKMVPAEEINHESHEGRTIFYEQISHMRVIILIVLIVGVASFRIPLLFGGFDINKDPNGDVTVGLDQNANVMGSGGGRNTSVTFGNGTFLVNDNTNVNVNGSSAGGGGTEFGFDKNGIIANGNLTVGNKTVKGGLGDGSNFLNQLATMFNV